jgi:hypothetical protein
MKKEETPILVAIPSCSSCLDQARNILFPNIFLKKKEEISWEFGDVSCLQFNYLRVETLTPTWEDFVGQFGRTFVGQF